MRRVLCHRRTGCRKLASGRGCFADAAGIADRGEHAARAVQRVRASVAKYSASLAGSSSPVPSLATPMAYRSMMPGRCAGNAETLFATSFLVAPGDGLIGSICAAWPSPATPAQRDEGGITPDTRRPHGAAAGAVPRARYRWPTRPQQQRDRERLDPARFGATRRDQPQRLDSGRRR